LIDRRDLLRTVDQMTKKRRVPTCKINFCCPYRTDLCVGRCTGEREPRDHRMVVIGDYATMGPDDRGRFTRYRVPEKTKDRFRKFDSGGDDDLSKPYVLETDNGKQVLVPRMDTVYGPGSTGG
jgi:hypothetical protein